MARRHREDKSVTPACGATWEALHAAGPMTASQLHAHMGLESEPEKTRDRLIALLHAGSVEAVGKVSTAGAHARVFRATARPTVREPALQAHVLELLGTLPRSYAEIREALRGRGERPNAQKLGNCLERLTREGKVTHEPINCVEVYRLAGASSRPSKRAPGAMRMSERLGTVEGPSGRRLMMRDEEWADG